MDDLPTGSSHLLLSQNGMSNDAQEVEKDEKSEVQAVAVSLSVPLSSFGRFWENDAEKKKPVMNLKPQDLREMCKSPGQKKKLKKLKIKINKSLFQTQSLNFYLKLFKPKYFLHFKLGNFDLDFRPSQNPSPENENENINKKQEFEDVPEIKPRVCSMGSLSSFKTKGVG